MKSESENIINGVKTSLGTIDKKHLDPNFLKAFDDMKLQIVKLTKMVNQLYYPYMDHK